MYMKYGTYILTAFETETERVFLCKKDMLKYLSSDIFARKESNSVCVLAFLIDSEGYKTIIKTKYSYDNRF